MGNAALRGVATLSFWADDVKAAKQWYSRLLEIEPYFERPDSEHPEYVEFRLGDYQHELGIISNRYAPKGAMRGPGGTVAFWHVDDVAEALEKVIAMGATEYEPLINREGGFVTASVVDPFGNILGLMYSPHFLEILESRKGRALEPPARKASTGSNLTARRTGTQVARTSVSGQRRTPDRPVYVRMEQAGAAEVGHQCCVLPEPGAANGPRGTARVLRDDGPSS